MSKRSKASFPLFHRFTSPYLVETTGYTADYLKKVRLGIRPANARFRARVLAALAKENVTEKALFGKVL